MAKNKALARAKADRAYERKQRRLANKPLPKADLDKMSAVLEHFAAPLLETTTDFEKAEQLVRIAAVAWNIAVNRALGRPDEALSLVTDPGELKAIEALIRRKNDRFPDLQRLIVDVQVEKTGPRSMALSVSSTAPLGK